MDFKLCLIFLLVSMAMVVNSSSYIEEHNWGVVTHIGNAPICVGSVGDCIGDDNEIMLDSEANRRNLATKGRFISYGALKKNQVPCGRRGQSYYNCQRRQKANPYKRGCSAITRCARFTD